MADQMVAAAKERAFGIGEAWFDTVVVVSVLGALDLHTAPRLLEAVDAATRRAPTAVIIDLAGVDFLGSAGMTALVTVHRAISPSAGFAVVADGPATSRQLTLVELDTWMTVTPTLAAALRSVGQD